VGHPLRQANVEVASVALPGYAVTTDPGRCAMRKLMTTLVVTCGVAVAVPAQADFQSGEQAYKSGDYATALTAWRQSAEEGDALSQTELGKLFRNGRGVERNDKQAVHWWRKAAEQSVGDAQAALGYMYVFGYGVDRDQETAYAWLLLAEKNGTKSGTDTRLSIETELTAAQIADAQKLANAWMVKHRK
jgi:hypothetical protein